MELQFGIRALMGITFGKLRMHMNTRLHFENMAKDIPFFAFTVSEAKSNMLIVQFSCHNREADKVRQALRLAVLKGKIERLTSEFNNTLLEQPYSITKAVYCPEENVHMPEYEINFPPSVAALRITDDTDFPF